MFVHDFLPLEHAYASLAPHVRHDGPALVGHAIANGRLTAPSVVEVGEPRERDDMVLLPVRVQTEDVHAPFVVLDVDVQLAPLGPGWSHLSVSGIFDRRGHDLGRHVDRLVDQRRTEAYLRTMLLDVAAELERRAALAERAHA